MDCAREKCQKKRKNENWQLRHLIICINSQLGFPGSTSCWSRSFISLCSCCCALNGTQSKFKIQMLINIQYPKIFPLVSADQILDSHFTNDTFLILLVPKNFAYLLSSLFFFNLSISLTQLERLLFTGKIQAGTFLSYFLLKYVLKKSVDRSKLYVHV